MARTASGYIQKLVWHWQNNTVTWCGQHPPHAVRLKAFHKFGKALALPSHRYPCDSCDSWRGS
jgi:hypothetical protein